MTSAELRNLFVKLYQEQGVDFFVKKEKGNIMTVRFWVEDEETETINEVSE